jgi:tribbles-like protein
MQSLTEHLESLSWEKEEKERKLSARRASRCRLTPAEELEEDIPDEAVTAVGQYLVPLSALEGEPRSVPCIDSCTGEQLSCRVYNYKFFQSKAALFSSGYIKGVHPLREVLSTQSRSHALAFSNTNYGDLHQYLREKKRLSEVEAAPLFRQIVELVRGAHSQGIALRDIKLKKFVFEDVLR